ncbi:MAG: hypothetical protein JW910_12635, partial [Anaerolineae bacterium]|nr:hypothetical protein [Anaerolineae bacterium]
MTLNTTRWRTHPQTMRFKAAFIRPVAVFERRVDQSSFTYPLAEIVYDDPDGGEGVYTDVKQHMTFAVYDGTSGERKGLGRVRKTPTSSTFYINETSAGDINFADNDRLVVYDDYRLWARVPRMSPNRIFYKDYDITHTNESEFPLPIANAGPHIACDVDPDTGKAQIHFSSTGSYRVALEGSVTLSVLWDVADGTITEHSATYPVMTAEFPAGQRWVELAVTDSNGQSARAVVAVITCDTTTNPPVEVQVTRLSGSAATGWDCAVRVLAEDVSDLLPGTLMILYADETYGTDEGAVQGVTDREGVKFVGWLTDEEPVIEPFGDTLTLTARSPLGVMQRLPAYSVSFEYDLMHNQWHHLIGANWFRALAVLMTWHTTIPLVCDVERPDFWDGYYFPAADIGGSTVYDQLKSEAERAWTRLTCDRAGRLYLRRNPHLKTSTERAALTTTVALTAADWRQAVRIRRRAQGTIGGLRGSGWTSHLTDSELKLALAPGDSPGPAPGQSDLMDRLIADQTELNVRLGHEYARQNSLMPELQLTLSHQGMAVEPAWDEVVTFTLDEETNRRGVGFNAELFVSTSLEVAHDAERGVTTETLTLEPLAEGAPATTQVVPDGDWEDEDWTPPPPPRERYTPPDPPGENVPEFPDLVYGVTTGEIRRSLDFTSASPTWSSNLITRPSGYVIAHAALAHSDPKNTMWVVMTNTVDGVRLYKTTNLGDVSPTWSLVRTLSYTSPHFCLLRNAPWGDLETWFLFYQGPSNTLRCAHTHDNWTTVTDVVVNSTITVLMSVGVEVSGHPTDADTGVVFGGGKSGSTAIMNKSTNFGASFGSSVNVETASYPPISAHMPWLGNEDALELFVMGGNASAYDAWVKYTNNGGTSFSDRTPSYGGYGWGGGERDIYMRELLHGYTLDEDIMACVGYRSADKRGSTSPRLFTSTDRGATWTHRGQFAVDVYNVNGWPYD